MFLKLHQPPCGLCCAPGWCSCSHSWPHAQVAGSLLIEDQIRTLKSRVHVFGHTHMNHSAVIDGCLYVQNAFASVAAVYVVAGSFGEDLSLIETCL